MAKRPDSPAGARFRTWLVKQFGTVKQAALTKGADYYYEETGNGSSLLRFTDSGVAKILGRNTLRYSEKSGRPKKQKAP